MKPEERVIMVAVMPVYGLRGLWIWRRVYGAYRRHVHPRLCRLIFPGPVNGGKPK